MTISKNQITYHAAYERTDRLALIGATVGFGEIVLQERFSPEKGSWSCFMDSGAMLIWYKNKKRLVTGFIPTKEQVMWTYRKPLNKSILKLLETATKKYQKGLMKI